MHRLQIATMASNVQLNKYKGLVQLIEQYKRDNNMTYAELNIDLLNMIYNLVEENTKYAIAVPRFAFEALKINEQTKEIMNKINYRINAKKNTLKSLSKEYMKRNGKQNLPN